MTDQPTPRTEAAGAGFKRRLMADGWTEDVIDAEFAAIEAQARTEALDVKRTHEIGTDPHCDWCERYAAILAAKADR